MQTSSENKLLVLLKGSPVILRKGMLEPRLLQKIVRIICPQVYTFMSIPSEQSSTFALIAATKFFMAPSWLLLKISPPTTI